jgi:hypothetical protein
MVLLGDEAQVDARFYLVGDSAILDARWVHCVHRTNNRLGNCFGRTRWNSLVTWVMSNLISVYLKMVLVSVQDRCTICGKRIIGSEIVLHAPDGTARRQGSSGSSFWSIWR